MSTRYDRDRRSPPRRHSSPGRSYRDDRYPDRPRDNPASYDRDVRPRYNDRSPQGRNQPYRPVDRSPPRRYDDRRGRSPPRRQYSPPPARDAGRDRRPISPPARDSGRRYSPVRDYRRPVSPPRGSARYYSPPRGRDTDRDYRRPISPPRGRDADRDYRRSGGRDQSPYQREREYRGGRDSYREVRPARSRSPPRGRPISPPRRRSDGGARNISLSVGQFSKPRGAGTNNGNNKAGSSGGSGRKRNKRGKRGGGARNIGDRKNNNEDKNQPKAPTADAIKDLPEEEVDTAQAKELVPDTEKVCWFFLDPKSEVQGPHSMQQLKEWMMYCLEEDNEDAEAARDFVHVSVCQNDWTRRIKLKSLVAALGDDEEMNDEEAKADAETAETVAVDDNGNDDAKDEVDSPMKQEKQNGDE